jgi:hypothetical protein
MLQGASAGPDFERHQGSADAGVGFVTSTVAFSDDPNYETGGAALSAIGGLTASLLPPPQGIIVGSVLGLAGGLIGLQEPMEPTPTQILAAFQEGLNKIGRQLDAISTKLDDISGSVTRVQQSVDSLLLEKQTTNFNRIHAIFQTANNYLKNAAAAEGDNTKAAFTQAYMDYLKREYTTVETFRQLDFQPDNVARILKSKVQVQVRQTATSPGHPWRCEVLNLYKDIVAARIELFHILYVGSMKYASDFCKEPEKIEGGYKPKATEGYCTPLGSDGDLCRPGASSAQPKLASTCQSVDNNFYLNNCNENCARARCTADDNCAGYTIRINDQKIKLKGVVQGTAGSAQYKCFEKASQPIMHSYSTKEAPGYCTPSDGRSGDLCAPSSAEDLGPGPALDNTCRDVDSNSYLNNCGEMCARQRCSQDANCKGYTIRHTDSKIKLKNMIDGTKVGGVAYSCVKKEKMSGGDSMCITPLFAQYSQELRDDLTEYDRIINASPFSFGSAAPEMAGIWNPGIMFKASDRAVQFAMRYRRLQLVTSSQYAQYKSLVGSNGAYRCPAIDRPGFPSGAPWSQIAEENGLSQYKESVFECYTNQRNAFEVNGGLRPDEAGALFPWIGAYGTNTNNPQRLNIYTSCSLCFTAWNGPPRAGDNEGC